MALFSLNFESRFLRSNTSVNVIVPDLPRDREPSEFYANEQGLPVLWLLHGTFGDHSDWVRKTNIERYAAERSLVVVMPAALNSNYSNWSKAMMGFDMYDFLTEELMPMVYNWLPVSEAREDNFIAGLSMGGRGAIKFAVNQPDRFAAAAILSAAPMDFSLLTEDYLNDPSDLFAVRLRGMVDNAGGLDAFRASEENVWRVIDERVTTGDLPRLLFATGTDDDFVYPNLVAFRSHAEEIGLEAEYWTPEGLGHEWALWDMAIQRALDFFDLPHRGANPF
ncbi:alpha/beta hydrolase [Demequina muriae]|uniref:Alpha/beta hydrolase-fold protein n=1 Tax=Demequina muriae TaxID=3051664 RepID=A0ABT8GH15_9MICO|nr:alpha/beta hydrolase-fold protein [Demequina sp. EGI L300058]MDN4480561.1 alpha/beta hydrolase-fold protein [Demequina sp. EGI L300058]